MRLIRSANSVFFVFQSDMCAHRCSSLRAQNIIFLRYLFRVGRVCRSVPSSLSQRRIACDDVMIYRQFRHVLALTWMTWNWQMRMVMSGHTNEAKVIILLISDWDLWLTSQYTISICFRFINHDELRLEFIILHDTCSLLQQLRLRAKVSFVYCTCAWKRWQTLREETTRLRSYYLPLHKASASAFTTSHVSLKNFSTVSVRISLDKYTVPPIVCQLLYYYGLPGSRTWYHVFLLV